MYLTRNPRRMAGSLLWKYPPVVWMIFILGCGLIFIANLGQTENYSIKSTFLSPPKAKYAMQTSEEMKMNGFLIRTPGCTIPDMKAMDKSIRKFIFDEDEVNCNNGIPALVNSDRTSIYINESAISYYNISDIDQLRCCFQVFKRTKPTSKSVYSSIKYRSKCVDFDGSVNVPFEFIRVQCYTNNTNIYKDFFNFVPLKGANALYEKGLNVLVIGIDAVSRLNFHRQMPQTVQYLHKLGSVEMFGYNKVGDNTFPNLMPILTGMSEEELKANCWPTQDSYFDKCPFIWKEYARNNYTTGFGEDSSWMGLFSYLKRGFINQPTDYFWNTFDLTAGYEIGNHHRLNVDQCIGARSVYKVFLDYVENYALTLHESRHKFFGFFWGSSLSHDFLNKPKLGDADYYDFLHALNSSGLLDRTALIVLSDHGIRWGNIRSTYQGRMEERLPFLFISLPEWYRNAHKTLYSNLKANRRRLTTPFDLYETLKDLIDSNSLTDDFLAHRNDAQLTQRGYSLFDVISINRSCDNAGISPHWCTCQTSKRISVDDPIAIEAANFTINEHINELLIGYADCAILELDEMLDARIQLNTNDVMKMSYSTQDYSLMFKTRPGGAIFEATIRRYKQKHDYHFNVTGSVSRLNLYGQQSKCISDFHLKLYCYCKQYLS